MSKGIEETIFTVMIKLVLWEFNLYWKFMCTDENNDENKKTSPNTVTVFLIAEKLISLSMTLKFSDFQFVSINTFVKNWA